MDTIQMRYRGLEAIRQNSLDRAAKLAAASSTAEP
jgi:hypothetical protein